MKLIRWFRTKSCTLKVGFFLAVLHVLFIVWVVNMIGLYPDAQWELIWLLPQHIDFPISLLLWYLILPFVPDITFYFLPDPLGDLWGFIAPFVFYLVGGTIWYFYLPALLEKISRKIATKFANQVLVGLLMIGPIFISWLHLLVWSDMSRYYYDYWIDVFICAFWIILFIWLYFANSQKKQVLWLLCLLPLVFFYLLRDLYLYIKTCV